MPDGISLVSLNIEGDRHLEPRIFPFLARALPDVLCLQEVYEADFYALKKQFGFEGVFVPMANHPSFLDARGRAFLLRGISILSRLPIRISESRYYAGSAGPLPVDFKRLPNGDVDQKTVKKVFAWMTVMRGGEPFTVGTTHFTWSPDGEATDDQRRDSDALLAILRGIPEIVWCGDLNAPRGGEIFANFASQYRDHIPAHYTTSIDGQFHRKGPLEKMVDGLFSTPQYSISNVELVSGLSDHCAITATIQKKPAT